MQRALIMSAAIAACLCGPAAFAHHAPKQGTVSLTGASVKGNKTLGARISASRQTWSFVHGLIGTQATRVAAGLGTPSRPFPANSIPHAGISGPFSHGASPVVPGRGLVSLLGNAVVHRTGLIVALGGHQPTNLGRILTLNGTGMQHRR